MKKAPESYLDCRRPPLVEALRLEHAGTIEAALRSLDRKGYFTPPPRPWQLGSEDRGMGRSNWAVLDRFGDLVAEVQSRETAEFIVSAANAYRTS